MPATLRCGATSVDCMSGDDGDQPADSPQGAAVALTASAVVDHRLIRDDNPSALDLLGFEDVVEVVEEITLRDDLDPVTVGVNAPWGSGKTTLLRLLEARLADRDDVVCIFVSPWEYDNKTDPTTALIDEVLGGLASELEDRAGVEASIRQVLGALRQRVRVAKAIKLAASAAMSVTIPGTAALLSLFEDEETDEPTVDPSLQGFREEFETLMDDKRLASIKRVVVLVDDLDRALPDTVVETLEAIKLFLSVPHMAFVVAADVDNVTNAISRRLATTGQPTTALNYLEKIVQVPVRVPTLTAVQTEEYLGLLMLDAAEGAPLDAIRASRPSGTGRLVERLTAVVPDDRLPLLDLAEQFAPLLHQQTTGNPRRIKRFLNAYWLRVSIASRRDVGLDPMVMAKLMLAELHYPDLFGLILSWLAAGNIPENLRSIEDGESDLGDAVHRWGALQPPLTELDLTDYLQLAASLRGETVQVAMLPENLRPLAATLSAQSDIQRSRGIEEAADLGTDERTVLVRFLAASIRQQRAPDSQRVIADSISGLCIGPAEANTAVEELRRMPHSMIAFAVPLALLSRNNPAPLITVVEEWRDSQEVSDLVRNAAVEALQEV